MTDNKVAAVLFDYGGVLRREEASEFDAFAARYGLPAGTLWSAFHDIPEYRASRTGKIDDDTYRAAVTARLATLIGDEQAAACLTEWAALRAQDSLIVPEMLLLIRRLRTRVKVGLLSNSGRGARAHLQASTVGPLFHDILCSAEVGLAKPEPAVYLLAAQRLGVSAAACVFVDDMEHNVLGARAVGMRAFHFSRARHLELLRYLEGLGVLSA